MFSDLQLWGASNMKINVTYDRVVPDDKHKTVVVDLLETVVSDLDCCSACFRLHELSQHFSDCAFQCMYHLLVGAIASCTLLKGTLQDDLNPV